MKTFFLGMAVCGFACYGCVNIVEGELKTGIAAILLAVVNGALLS